jgi:hypothetical protein
MVGRGTSRKSAEERRYLQVVCIGSRFGSVKLKLHMNSAKIQEVPHHRYTYLLTIVLMTVICDG